MNNLDSKSKLAITAYLLHLLLPLLLIADIVLAWRFPSNAHQPAAPTQWWVEFGTTGQLVFTVSIIWIVFGLTIFLVAYRFRMYSKQFAHGFIISIYTVILSLVIVEIFLHVLTEKDSKPALWPQGQETLLRPNDTLMPGIHGKSKFTGNDVGLRGANFPKPGEQTYKIVAIGGSTTESLYLDDDEEWPHLLMDYLNDRQMQRSVWVANGGQSGRNSVDHLQLIQILPVIDKVQMLVFMIGINDLNPTLALGGRSTNELLTANAVEFRKQVLNGGERLRPPKPYFKHSRIFTLAKRSSAQIVGLLTPTTALGWVDIGPGSYIANKRELRSNGNPTSLPDLRTGLEEYEERIRSLDNECRDRELRCLFLTQPSMWRGDLSPKEESLLWFGWISEGPLLSGYISTPDLAEAMDEYNQRLLSVCLQEQLECFDLASVVPKDISSFYDDVHLNEGGSKTVARELAGYISSTPPFSKQSP